MDSKENFISALSRRYLQALPATYRALNTGQWIQILDERLFTGAFWKHKLAILCQNGLQSVWRKKSIRTKSESTSSGNSYILPHLRSTNLGLD